MKSRFKLNIFTIITLIFGVCMIFIGSKELRIAAAFVCMGLTWYVFADFRKVLFNSDMFQAIKDNNLPKLRLLMMRKISPDIYDNEGLAPIHHAALKGSFPMIEALVNGGASVDAMTRTNGNTALHIAAMNGNYKIVEYLVKNKAKTNAANFSNCTPLYEACAKNQKDIAAYLISCGAVYQALDNWTSLHEAALKGDIELVENLIAQGANVNIRDNDGRTPLHAAAALGKINVANLLITEGADVNLKNRYGDAAVHIAAQHGNLDMIKFLNSKNGAFILESGKNALHEAAENGFVELCDYFLQQGMSVNSRNEKALTALHVAASKGKERVVAYLIGKGADINAKNDKGETPLIQAIYGNNKDIVKLLVSKGANPNARNSNGETPLHLIDFKDGLEVAKALIECGADVNIRDKFGYTPLSRATKINNEELASLFRKNYIAGKLIDQAVAENKNAPAPPMHPANK